MKTGIDAAEALQIILDATPVLGAETLSTREALGRVLVEDIHSDRTLPPADCSAMDGYAVRREDLRGASADKPGVLAVSFEVAAGGQAERALQPTESARIFTGAPVPPGADAVVRQEDAEQEGDRVRIFVEPAPREHIRDAGEELQVGDSVLAAGVPLRAPEIGVLAALGRSVVAVSQRARVSVLSGGDELVEPDGDISGGRIVASNAYTLAAQCREVGAEAVNLGIARDDPSDIERRLRAGLRGDCIVSSAGVSVGDHDHVRDVLEGLGCELHFWGVQIKPGYPLVFGTMGAGSAAPGALVFGLPGNPVSASVTFDQFARPALRKMMGFTTYYRPTLRARLSHPLTKKAGRMHFVRVCLEERDGEIFASSTGTQSSGVLLSLSLADGLLVFPKDETELAAGAEVSVQLWKTGSVTGHAPGF